jgi:hypothetical protein
MTDGEALIRVFAPAAQGIADGAMISLAVGAPMFAFALYGLWRRGNPFSGKSARAAAMRALASGKGRP